MTLGIGLSDLEEFTLEISVNSAAIFVFENYPPTKLRLPTFINIRRIRIKMAASFVITFAIFIAIASKIFLEFSQTVSRPYMDEIFHIPQAQNYCHGNYFYWDNKITTLPGLYIFSQIYLKVFATLQGLQIKDLCDVKDLRLTNVIFIALTFVYLYQTFRTYNHGKRFQVIFLIIF